MPVNQIDKVIQEKQEKGDFKPGDFFPADLRLGCGKGSLASIENGKRRMGTATFEPDKLPSLSRAIECWRGLRSGVTINSRLKKPHLPDICSRRSIRTDVTRFMRPGYSD